MPGGGGLWGCTMLLGCAAGSSCTAMRRSSCRMQWPAAVPLSTNPCCCPLKKAAGHLPLAPLTLAGAQACPITGARPIAW